MVFAVAVLTRYSTATPIEGSHHIHRVPGCVRIRTASQLQFYALGYFFPSSGFAWWLIIAIQGPLTAQNDGAELLSDLPEILPVEGVGGRHVDFGIFQFLQQVLPLNSK